LDVAALVAAALVRKNAQAEVLPSFIKQLS
jgi:hypothetical protein